jgi:hypothetical protein
MDRGQELDEVLLSLFWLLDRTILEFLALHVTCIADVVGDP